MERERKGGREAGQEMERDKVRQVQGRNVHQYNKRGVELHKNNSEANNKVYDSNHKTVAALDRLAKVYETFEDTWAFVEKEFAEGDMLLAAQ